MIQLRPYQETQIIDLSKRLVKSKKVILCLPTGGGKTVIFTTIVERHLTKSLFNRVLVVTDRLELFNQTFKALDRLNIDPEIYGAQKKGHNYSGRCIVGMIETIKRRKAAGLGQFTLIIIDEAHKGNFRALFDLFPDALFIGATATPLSSKKDDPLKNYYQDISFVIDTPELIDLGFLAPAKSFHMVLLDESKLKKQNGEFTEKSQQEQYDTIKLFDGLYECYISKAKGKKSMVFCANIASTLNTADFLRNKGLNNVFSVTSISTKEERKQQLDAFHASTDGIMVNCGILTTGYDHPAVECIILYRATLSLSLFLQMCGRGSRPYPNKDFFTIIDLGTNIKRFLLWENERDWRKMFFNPPKKNEGVAPVKTCPQCEAIIPASATECPYCGAEIPKKGKKEEIGILVEATIEIPKHLKNRRIQSLSVAELIELQNVKNYKNGFITRILRAKGHDALIEYAYRKGYSNGWVNFNLTGSTDFTNFIIK
jgi:superfamily II DNA or RNA helicase